MLVLSNRYSWRPYGGYFGQLQLSDRTLVLEHTPENLKLVKAALGRCIVRYAHAMYSDAAYTGPAGCPDTFDESCPSCPAALPAEHLTKDLCNSEYGGY